MSFPRKTILSHSYGIMQWKTKNGQGSEERGVNECKERLPAGAAILAVMVV